jgi:hypothetical protein
VDAADYVVWKNTLGQTMSGAGAIVAAAVPEPASGVLLLVSAAPLVAYFRRRPK